jgi:threonyl-tRNA synthetase
MSYQFDHRQLADEMEIFFFDDQIGVGLPVWLPNGVAIRDALESFIKHQERRQGYQRVISPHIGKGSLFEASGHLKSFGDNMFPPMKWPDEQVDYYLRPMNCPHHHKVFSSSQRSYRDLPLRIAEYGQVYRYENSGSLRGLIRARCLCQNDAHIYVNPSDAKNEVGRVLDLHEFCYSVLGLKGYRYRLSKHDPNRPDDFDGPHDEWLKSEDILRQSLIEKNLPFFEADGEAAFYGPKIDVQMKVGPAEEESVASVQLDFNSAKKFDLKYIASSGELERPWVIHRAPLGSHERFVSLLLEFYDGQLPGWLSPVQLYVIPIGEEGLRFAQKLEQELIKHGIRVMVDNNAGSLSKRVLFAHRLRPFAKIVIGQKEAQGGPLELQLRDRKVSCNPGNLVEKIKPMIAAPG